MSYIKQEEKEKFKVSMETAVDLIMSGNESDYIKGEFFGYFINRISTRFLGDPNYTNPSFNSSVFNVEKKKLLTNCADKMSAMLNRSDPMGSAGDYNYIITGLYFNVLGFERSVIDSNYGFRTYLTGMLEKISSSIETVNIGNQRDTTIAFRRHLIIRGVLNDAIRRIGVTNDKMIESYNRKEIRDG